MGEANPGVEIAPGNKGAMDDGAREVSLTAIATVLVQNNRVIMIAGVLGLVFGIASGLLSTRRYASSALFVPQASTDVGNAGGLALAASQFGIRIPSGGGGWGSAVYVELLHSNTVLSPIAMDSVTVVEEGGRRATVADLFEIEEADSALRLEKTVRTLRDVVAATENRRLGSVRVVVTTKWPSVSYALVQRLLAEVNRFNIASRQSQASEERQFAESQAAESERALRNAEERMRDFLETNQVVSSPQLMYQRERIQREITIRQQAFMSLLQSVSEARLREVRDTPVITVLEPPMLPSIGEPRRSAMKGVIGSVAATLIAVIIILSLHARAAATGDAVDFFRAVDGLVPRMLRRR